MVTGWVRVVVPRAGGTGLAAAAHGYAALHATGMPVRLTLAGTHRDVGVWAGVAADRLATLVTVLRAAYPDAQLVPDTPPQPDGAAALVAARWRLAGPPALPLHCPAEERDGHDPVALLFGALADARAGECGLVSLVLAPASTAALARALGYARRLELGSGWTGAPPRVLPADVRELIRAARLKATQPAFTVALRTGWAAATSARAAQAHQALLAAFGPYTVPGRTGLLARPARAPAAVLADVGAGRPPRRRERLLLGCAELAALTHLPGGEVPAPHLARTGARRAAAWALADGALTLAEGTFGDGGEPVGVTVDQLMHHAYVIGPSGTGKTSLLARLVAELAERWVAAVVLDPHGDLTRACLMALPAGAVDRLRVLDLTDVATIPSLNPLWVAEQPSAAAAAVARATRSAAVTAVFADIWRLHRAVTPNLLHFLEAALAALVAGAQPLAALPAFLTDAAYRARVLAAGGDARLHARWAEFAALPATERARAVRAILNKAADFDRNPLLATVFGDAGPGLRLAEIMDGGGVLLVNLPRGLVPEGTGELIGSLLVTCLYQEALAREARPAAQRPPVVAVIDEFQEFALSAFAKVVTATRKYGLGLVVANQNTSRLAALDPDVLATLLANVGTLVAFRLAAEDARRLAPSFPPFGADDLGALAAYETYWRIGARVTSARTVPARPVRTPAQAADLLAAARLPGRPLRLSSGVGDGGRGAWP